MKTFSRELLRAAPDAAAESRAARACAIEYAHSNAARSPILALYCETFPGFLSAFPPAAELPCLPDVARIDRMWVEARTACDVAALTSAELVQMTPAALGAQRMTLHPATRIGWFAHSAAAIWIHHRSEPSNPELTVEDSEEIDSETDIAGLLAQSVVAGAFIRSSAEHS
jgi:hypothetical protein